MMCSRERALDMVTAAMAVIIQTQDLMMSAEIIDDAGNKYGVTLVEKILLELTTSDLTFDLSMIAEDIKHKRATLAMMRALPKTWMKTRN